MYFPIISIADNELLNYYKKFASCPTIRTRMMSVDLRCRHVKPKVVCFLLGIHPNSVTNWVKMYIYGGVAALLQIEHYRPKSDLVTYREQIAQDFDAKAPKTIGEARKRIAQLTGLKRGITQIRCFLKKVLKYKYRKYRRTSGGKLSIPALNELQTTFLSQTLFPLIAKAKRKACEVFFVDGVHPVQGFHQGEVWSKEPVVVRTSSGRQRVNILGALNALHPSLYSITEDKYINSLTVCELITFLREEHPGRQLYMIMDNASYQRCDLVAKHAKKLRVNLVFLPPYSPNLNLIERLWKFMKKEALAGEYFATKQEFIDAVNRFIDQLNEGLFDDDLRALLNTNFQTLEVPSENHMA